MASTLTVITTPKIDGADEILSEISVLQKMELIKVEDAATVKRSLDGKPKIKQAVGLVGQGALGGAFWGMLIGFLFLMPWLIMMIGWRWTFAVNGLIGIVWAAVWLMWFRDNPKGNPKVNKEELD